MTAAAPLDVYKLNPRKSIIDNIWISKTLKRPVYATTTRQASTIVWRVEVHGALIEVGRIDWESGMVDAAGTLFPIDEFFIRSSKSIFSNESKIARLGDLQLKWKLYEGEGWAGRSWRCALLPLNNLLETANQKGKVKESSTSNAPAAIFMPPLQTTLRAEIQIFACPMLHKLPNTSLSRANVDQQKPLPPTSTPEPYGPTASSSTTHFVRRTSANARPGRATNSSRERNVSGNGPIGYQTPSPFPRARSNSRNHQHSLSSSIGSSAALHPQATSSVLPGAGAPGAQFPPQPDMMQMPPDLQDTDIARALIQPPSPSTIDSIIVCCVILAARKEEWKTNQSEGFGNQSGGNISAGMDGPIGEIPAGLYEIQRQLNATFLEATGSTSTLPMYRPVDENPDGLVLGFSSGVHTSHSQISGYHLQHPPSF